MPPLKYFLRVIDIITSDVARRPIHPGCARFGRTATRGPEQTPFDPAPIRRPVFLRSAYCSFAAKIRQLPLLKLKAALEKELKRTERIV